MKTENLIYTAKKLKSMHFGFLSKMICIFVRICFSCDIPAEVQIGTDFSLAHHGLGVVINREVIIGNNVKIYQNVTIGRRKSKKIGGGGTSFMQQHRSWRRSGYPR